MRYDYENNPDYAIPKTHLNECLIKTFCEKSSFYPKNFSSADPKPQSMMPSLMDRHWTEEHKRQKYLDPERGPYIRETLEDYK